MMNRSRLFLHLATICILTTIGVWWPVQYAKIAVQPLYDSAQYITMAYNIAKYNVSSVSTEDTPQLQPDFLREPAPSFFLSLPMRAMNFDRHPLSCLLGEKAPCDDMMQMERMVNIIVAILVIPGVYLAAYWLTLSYGWAVAAAVVAATSSILPSFVFIYSSELFGALFLLWHSLLFYGAVAGRRCIVCALSSGLFLAALILTKAVYLYWMLCLAAIAVAAFLLPRRFGGRAVGATLIFVLLPALAGVGAWMTRNYALSGEFALAGRAESVLAIRAGYTAMSWTQYFAGYAYFTPYVGPDVARYLFGDLAAQTYDDNIPGGVQRHIAAGMPTTTEATPAEQRREIFGIMVKNWEKNLALMPLLSYRGMFVGGCCTTLGNTVPIYGYDAWSAGWLLRSFQIFLTVLLGPAMLWLCVLLVRRRMWPYFAFVGIVVFHFLIHAAATQFYARFSVPVYPNLVVMLCVLLWLLAKERIPSSGWASPQLKQG